MIRFQFDKTEELLTITFTGCLDSNTSPDAQKEILNYLEHISAKRIRLDMSELEYMSSAGLRLILKLKEIHREKELEIINVNAAVFEVFFITGINRIFHITPPKEYMNKSKYLKEISANMEQRKAEKPEKSPWMNAPDTALTGINDTTEHFRFVSVVDMFREQAEKHPDKTAVVSTTASLTYKKLDELSDKVANILNFMGVQSGDVIMVMLPRSVDIYIATLGILKAGAAYTIVNVKYPDDRIAYIYQDADCKYMISNNPTVMDRLELIADVLKKRPLFMEALLSISYTGKPVIQISETDLCYLIYTSGSTGKPKGVMIEHGNLTNFVYPTKKNYEANGITQKGNVLLAMAQMTFDISVMEEFLGLTSGLTVAFASEEEIMNPLLMKEFILKNRVDAMCCTPAYLNTLVSIPELREAIRQIMTYDLGAEAFPGRLFTNIRNINPDAFIMNGYGPTEATISCTMKVIESPEEITIGRPNANVYVFIVDQELRELPAGEIGELLICGLGVGRGYRNLPEKTAQSFISFRGMRGYRTGDLACINEKDEIEFHGRKDNQVKLRGLRIELDEVEQAIAKHEAVKQSAVKVFDDRVLVGYYTLRTPGTLSAQELKLFIEKTLAHYMVPEVLIELDKMPMTPNAKIDRKSLPKPEIREAEIVLPRTRDQEVISGIIQEIMEGTPIGITTNIMELGLSSLDTMVLASRLDEIYNVDVKFGDIYENPTVLLLEKMLLTKPKRIRREQKDRYRCYATIESVYRLIKADEASTQWNLPYLYTAKREAISPDRLKKAVITALNAHPGLWCRFATEDDAVYMIPDQEHGDCEIPVTEMTDREFEEYRGRLIRPFRSNETQLFRAEIYLTPTYVHLFMDLSHLIIDGESFDILLDDIDRAYRGEELNTEPFTIYDVIEEQRLFLENSGKEKAMQYYRDLFAKAAAPTLFHKDRQDKNVTTARYDRKLPFSREDIQNMTRPLRISDTVLFMGLLSAYVAKDGGKGSACYPMAYNGRSDSRSQGTVGFLAQMLFVLSSYDGDVTVGEYLQSLQRQIIRPMSFVCQPYLEMLGEYPELLTYAFSYLGEVSDEYPIGNASMKAEALSPEGSGGLYGILQEVMIKKGRYICSTEYRTNEHSEASIQRMTDALEKMLEHFDPAMKLTDLLNCHP